MPGTEDVKTEDPATCLMRDLDIQGPLHKPKEMFLKLSHQVQGKPGGSGCKEADEDNLEAI